MPSSWLLYVSRRVTPTAAAAWCKGCDIGLLLHARVGLMPPYAPGAGLLRDRIGDSAASRFAACSAVVTECAGVAALTRPPDASVTARLPCAPFSGACRLRVKRDVAAVSPCAAAA